MLFNFAYGLIGNLANFSVDTCCSKRERPDRKSNTMQHDAFTKAIESHRHSQVETGRSQVTPSAIMRSMEHISPAEQAMLKEAVIEPVIKRKTVASKSSLAENEDLIRKLHSDIDKVHGLDTWKVIYVSETLVMYMNQPPIDELSLRHNVQVYGFFTVECAPSRFIDIVTSKSLDPAIASLVTFESITNGSVQVLKQHTTYSPTLTTPEMEFLTQTIVRQGAEGYQEVTFSIVDPRFPPQEHITRIQVNLKGYRVWTVSETQPAPIKGPTAVMFYSDIVQGEIESYDGLDEELVAAQQSILTRIHELCQQ